MEIEDYHEIDKYLDNLDIKYEDIDVTYVIRNHIVATLRSDMNIGNSEIKLSKKIVWRLLKNAIKSIPAIFSSSNTWVFSNSERRKKIGDFYYDRVASIVSENISKTLFIENPVAQDHKFPSKDKILSDALFFGFSYLFSIIYFKKNKLIIDAKIYDYSKNKGIKINPHSRIKRFVGQYRFMKFYLKYFRKPKTVFVVFPNGYNGYIYAFKEFGIPVIELQHGVVYPLHPDYNTILGKKAESFKPNYFLLYGNQDLETVEKIKYLPIEKCFVVGSYGLWKSNENIQISEYLKDKLVKDKTLLIVATLIDIEELYDFAIQIGEKLNLMNIILLPRLQTLEFEDNNNVKVLDVTKTNIFETFKAADYLLTKISTAALESIHLDIPTFVLKEKDKLSTFEINYSNIKSFNYIENLDQLTDKITNENYIIPSQQDKNQVFSLNIKDNFINSMNTINHQNN